MACVGLCIFVFRFSATHFVLIRRLFVQHVSSVFNILKAVKTNCSNDASLKHETNEERHVQVRYLRRRTLIGQCVVLAWPQNGYMGVTLTHTNCFSHTNSIATSICTCKLTLAVTSTSMPHLVPAQLNIKHFRKAPIHPHRFSYYHTQTHIQTHSCPCEMNVRCFSSARLWCVCVHITVSVLPLNMLTVMTDSLTQFIHICSHVLGTHSVTPSHQMLQIY